MTGEWVLSERAGPWRRRSTYRYAKQVNVRSWPKEFFLVSQHNISRDFLWMAA